MKTLLSFEQAPPLDVPMRFYLTACLFGLFAGGLLAFGGEALTTRWSGVSLALTHLMTLGFMLQVMIGSLLQLMPVVIGSNLWRPRLIATWVHGLSSVGTIALCGAFLLDSAPLYLAAGTLLLGAVLPFGVLLLTVLVRSESRGAISQALQFAALALLLTVLLGVALAAARASSLGSDWLGWTTLHLQLGWLGWGLLLLAGVSYQVVPMFQLTPPYPVLFRRFFAPAVATILALSAISTPASPLHQLTDILACLSVLAFVIMTLRVQRKRRRQRLDVSLHFWRLALCSMALAAVIELISLVTPLPPPSQVSLGVLVLFGAFASVMSGMLYKIVPFLVWLHLQGCIPKPLLMHEVISESDQRQHLALHLPALLLSLLTPWQPGLAIVAGMAVFGAFAVLLRNLLRALLRYHRCRRASSPLVQGGLVTGGGKV